MDKKKKKNIQQIPNTVIQGQVLILFSVLDYYYSDINELYTTSGIVGLAESRSVKYIILSIYFKNM